MTGQRAFAPASLPAGIEATVVTALRAAHARDPFLPTDARTAAHRVVDVVTEVGLDARVLRGSLDLGGAELDHLFTVVDDRVVDVALPVNDDGFVAVLRAWVAGDVGSTDVLEAAAGLDLAARVVGRYPGRLRYRGAPLWGTAA